MKIVFKNIFIFCIAFTLTVAVGPSSLLICYGTDGHVEVELTNAKSCKIISDNINNVNNHNNKEIYKNADSGCFDYYLTSLSYYPNLSRTQTISLERISIPFNYTDSIKLSSNSFQILHSSSRTLTQVKALFLSEILLI